MTYTLKESMVKKSNNLANCVAKSLHVLPRCRHELKLSSRKEYIEDVELIPAVTEVMILSVFASEPELTICVVAEVPIEGSVLASVSYTHLTLPTICSV